MIKNAMRFALLRFLPRRLLPLLGLIEVVRVVRRVRGKPPEAVSPRRTVISGNPDPNGRDTDA